MRTLQEIQQHLPVSPEDGLPAEAVAESLRRFGANQLTPLPREPLWKKFLAKFDEPIIKILLAAALLSMIVDLFKPPAETVRYAAGAVAVGLAVLLIAAAYVLRRREWVPSLLFLAALLLWPVGLVTGHASYDGLAVMLAVVLATGVAFLSEYKSDREFELLNARKELQVKVLRGGEFRTLLLEDVVVGDAVILEMGDEIPADGRLAKANDLYVDQSLMTGESEPVHKRARLDDTADGPEQPGCLYRGTQVVDGVGQMIVTEVGDATYLGQIARRLSTEDDVEEEPKPDGEEADEQKRIKRKLTISKEATPLQQKLEHLAGLISKVGYIAAVAIFSTLLVRGIMLGEVRWPRSGGSTHTIRESDPIGAMAFAPDGRQLAVATWGLDPQGSLIGEVRLRDTATGQETQKLRGHTDLITAVALSPDGERAATAGRDDTLILWDVASGRPVHTLADQSGTITRLVFSPDGKHLAGAVDRVDGKGDVRVWDAQSGETLFTASGHGGSVLALAFSPDGQRLASAGADRTVRLWDTTGGEVAEFANYPGPVAAVAFSPDGQQLATVSGWDTEPGEVQIRAVSTGDVLQTFPGAAGSPKAVAFRPGGQQLLVASGGVREVFDLAAGKPVSTESLSGPVSALAVSATGQQIAAAGTGGIQVRDEGDAFWPVLLASAANLLQYFMYMVIIIVVAVPEGLPMSVTISLALAMRKMTRANSLVRQLVACETIGSATVICSDKTGTLTQNKMRVVRLGLGGRVHDRGAADWPRPQPREGKPVDWLALNAAVNSTANLEEKNGQLFPVGNSTEGSLLLWLHEAGIDYQQLREEYPPRYQVHFSSDRKRMTTVIRSAGRLLAMVKGAPEFVLQQCTFYLTSDGKEREWTPEVLATVREQLQTAASQAMRTLAFAHAWLPDNTPDDEDGLHERRESLENGLVFAGFVAIRDPLRDDVKDALIECRRAGIEVMMITGDNVETARAIGHDIGLVDSHETPIDTPDAPILTSAKFNELSDPDLKARLPQLRVVARARPLDKFRLVRLLQEQGEVVAVTGDGTNDAPALKKADVGLSMGRSGTEVAKEASKIVLLDDAFSTIVKAVHWGRSLYENIQRFIQFQLTINVSALIIAFLGPFFGIKPPFTILQLLWINVIMDTFASIALCSEPPRPGLMDAPPKRRDESILSRSMLITIFTTAAFFVVAMMTLLWGMEHGWAWLRGPVSERSTEFPQLTVWQVSLFFTVYVFFQVWNMINCRSLVPEVSGFRGVFRNLPFLGIAALIVLGQVLIVTFGGRIFKVEPLRLIDWLVIAAGTSSVLLFAEIVRRVRVALR